MAGVPKRIGMAQQKLFRARVGALLAPAHKFDYKSVITNHG
jgi:hypothetical protein